MDRSSYSCRTHYTDNLHGWSGVFPSPVPEWQCLHGLDRLLRSFHRLSSIPGICLPLLSLSVPLLIPLSWHRPFLPLPVYQNHAPTLLLQLPQPLFVRPGSPLQLLPVHTDHRLLHRHCHHWFLMSFHRHIIFPFPILPDRLPDTSLSALFLQLQRSPYLPEPKLSPRSLSLLFCPIHHNRKAASLCRKAGRFPVLQETITLWIPLHLPGPSPVLLHPPAYTVSFFCKPDKHAPRLRFVLPLLQYPWLCFRLR